MDGMDAFKRGRSSTIKDSSFSAAKLLRPSQCTNEKNNKNENFH